MRLVLRLFRRVAAGAVVLLLLFALGVAGLLWMTLPPSGQQLRLTGLTAPVDVTFDGDGVPRIVAATDEDAAAALGYVHARDRLFQMDLMRRVASGRLSELAGPATLRLDRTMRVLGLRRRAEADLAGLPAEVRMLLDRYASGVNAWIAERGRLSAPEFVLLGSPEAWTPTDSLLWGKTMALWLSGNYRTELARAAQLRTLAPDRVDELWPAQDAALQPDARLPSSAGLTRLAALLPSFPEPFTLPGSASNGWAVDGRHSATGAPLLAGDPHLAYGQPGIWYLARIDTPGGTLAGATAPGVPFVVLGHNGHIAWTFTTTGADTQDVFEETVLADGRYVTPDGPQAFVAHEERIRVRGQDDDVLLVRETRHGPVLSDLDAPGGPVLAVAMANLAPGDAAPGLLALNRARNVDEAGRAAALIVAPVQNLLVADRERIAQHTTGRVPVRRSGDGRLPVLGAGGEHDWTGFASGTDLPHFVAPESGRVVNANERVAPPDFPVFLGADWYGDWRARRIRALLDERAAHDAAGFAAMQVDVRSEFARDVLPKLQATRAADGLPRSALALLPHWDGSMDIDLPQPLILNAWIRSFETLIRARAGVTEGGVGPRAEFVAYVLSPAGAHWCGGDCGPWLAETLAESTAALAERFGPDPASWRWGAAHEARFAHPILGQLPILGPLTTATIEQPGDDNTLYRGGYRADFASVHGAGYRSVFDLGDLDRSLFIATPGQSGHLLSRHARDMMQRWRDGATITLGKRPAIVSDTIRLDP